MKRHAMEPRLSRVEFEPGEDTALFACSACRAYPRRVLTPQELVLCHEEALANDRRYETDKAKYAQLCAEYVVWKADNGRRRPTTTSMDGLTVWFDPSKFSEPKPPVFPALKKCDGLVEWRTKSGSVLMFCEPCLAASRKKCSFCGEEDAGSSVRMFKTKDGTKHVCSGCWTQNVGSCSACAMPFLMAELRSAEGSSRKYCSHCCRQYMFECRECHKLCTGSSLAVIIGERHSGEGVTLLECQCRAGANDVQPHNHTCERSRPGMQGFIKTEEGVMAYSGVCFSCQTAKITHNLIACPDCNFSHVRLGEDAKEAYPCGFAPHLGEWRIGRGRHHAPSRFFMTKREQKDEFSRPDLFLGFELEVEAQSGDSRETHTRRIRAPFLLFKEDGTLNNGIEIVSNPLSWAWIKENQEEIASRWRDLSKHGCRSFNTQTCGLHVHMTKDAYGSLHLYKVMMLLHKNVENISRLSQRRKEHLDQFAGLTREPLDRMSVKAKNRKGNQMVDKELREGMKQYPRCFRTRYVAFNMENDKTVEFRFFKGTLHPAGFFKALEFCHASYAFTLNASVAESSDWAKFCQFVQDNVRDYPHLAVFLKDMDTMKDDTETVEPQVVAAKTVETREQRLSRRQDGRGDLQRRRGTRLRPGDFVAAEPAILAFNNEGERVTTRGEAAGEEDL